MSTRRYLILAALALSGCSLSREPVALDAAEQRAVDHIANTPHLQVTGIRRIDETTLIVATRQGNDRLRYRVDTSNPEAASHDMVQRIPDSNATYHYDRSKPRGGFTPQR